MNSTEAAEFLRRAGKFAKNLLSMVVVAMAILLAVEMIVRAGEEAARLARRLGWSVPESKRLADAPYEGYPWREECLREWQAAGKFRYRPFFLWAHPSFAGNAVNIAEDGCRFTTPPSGGYLPDAKTVYCFGGSTMLGGGVSDEFSIPSLLQRKAGGGYRLVNYGTSSYVAEQSLHRLLVELTRGHVPDAMVFYDGVNDAYAGAYGPAKPRAHQQYEDFESLFDSSRHMRAMLQKSHLVRALSPLVAKSPKEKWDILIKDRIPANARATVESYLQTVETVKRLGRAYDFETYFFWQPVLLWGKRAPIGEEAALVAGETPTMRSAFAAVYDEAASRLRNREQDRIFFLADVLDDAREPLYVDFAHLGPRGNELVAERIYNTMKAEGSW